MILSVAACASFALSLLAYSPKLPGSTYKTMEYPNCSSFPKFVSHLSLAFSSTTTPRATPDDQYTRSGAQLGGPLSTEHTTSDVENEIKRAYPTSEVTTEARKSNPSSTGLPTNTHQLWLLWTRWYCPGGRNRLWTGKPRSMGNRRCQRPRYRAITGRTEWPGSIAYDKKVCSSSQNSEYIFGLLTISQPRRQSYVRVHQLLPRIHSRHLRCLLVVANRLTNDI